MSKNKWLNKIQKYKLDYVALFVLVGGYFTKLQWNNYIGDPDGFYHTKIAQFLGDGIVLKSLPWMQFSTLTNNFTDHHFLYHILLVPFTYFNDPLIGIKIATVLFATVMVLVFYWLLKKFDLKYAWIFALLFITMEATIFRLGLVKANSLSLLIIWFLIYALYQKKYWLTVLLGFIFVWLYGGWPISLIILVTYLIAEYIYKKIHTNKLKIFWSKIIRVFYQKPGNNFKISLSLIAGLILGLIINPYWPKNLYFYYQQIVQIGIVNLGQQITVGGEWYGTNLMAIISSGAHIFVLASVIFIILVLNHKIISRQTWFSFILSLIFLLLTLKSRRYVEYFWPFVLFFTACGLTDIIKKFNWSVIKKFWRSISSFQKVYLGIVSTVFIIFILVPVWQNIIETKIPHNHAINKFEAATTWLASNTPPQSIILHSDWDEWPILFYNNDQNYYIMGLDPTFMYNFDKDLHQKFVSITTGKYKYNLDKQIKQSFDADYIFVEKKSHQALINNLEENQNINLVYEDELSQIYFIEN